MTMIPHIIHYCWFGHNPLPKSARKCIDSWRRYFPDYEIKEWNESNFDVMMNAYIREAYGMKKYAFVSDFARFYVLYHYGGIYFDTDVKVIRHMDDIIERGAFMGLEQLFGVNPGLGLGAEAGHPLYKEIMKYYAGLHFLGTDGMPLPGTVVKYTTDVLLKHGLELKPEIQHIAGVWIYPTDYFDPLDDATGRLTITENTRSIHLYSKTWVDNYGPLRNWATRLVHRIFGVDCLSGLKKRLQQIIS